MNKKIALFIFPKLYLLLIYSITLTCKKRWEGQENIKKLKEKNQNWIYTLWHNCIAISCWTLRNQDLTLLVSNSKDGEMVSQAIRFMGNNTVRGSSSKGALKAILQLVKKLKKGVSIAITPDGPRGPRYKLQIGAISIANRSGVPLLPIHCQASRQWIVNSWDRHQIPKPFSTIVISVGEPYYLPENKMPLEELENQQSIFEAIMLQNAQKTQTIIDGL
ncbi:MAG: lysophospholipid acyltransferase family protein [Proteobacteria bacterium]|nr:lysophospholipid acyltransferase family protein [Pseudomonadota bacterium]